LLLDHPILQKTLGERARAKVRADHDPSVIGKNMEDLYHSAIIERRRLGSR
jgi:hypothetical protein